VISGSHPKVMKAEHAAQPAFGDHKIFIAATPSCGELFTVLPQRHFSHFLCFYNYFF
jgi:hypothetical protein